MILRGLYTILLGVFLVLFVGIGISTFYPEPVYKPPTSCMAPQSIPVEKGIAPSTQQVQCQKDQEVQQEHMNFYSEVVSSIALIIAVIYVVVSLVIFRDQPIFSYGFLFGCIFTLLYSLFRGLNSNHTWFAFIIVVISLILVMTIGYLRFVRSDIDRKSSKRKS